MIGGGIYPMKTPEQYEAEIADLKELIRKMQIQLTAALETVAENHKPR